MDYRSVKTASSYVSLFLLKLYHHVTDRQTDGHDHSYFRAQQSWRAVKKAATDKVWTAHIAVSKFASVGRHISGLASALADGRLVNQRAQCKVQTSFFCGTSIVISPETFSARTVVALLYSSI